VNNLASLGIPQEMHQTKFEWLLRELRGVSFFYDMSRSASFLRYNLILKLQKAVEQVSTNPTTIT
jgi:hypothetical protein